MATEQATGAARCGTSCKTGNAVCRHIFPALGGRVSADDRLRHGFCQGSQPWRQAVTGRIVSSKRDASGAGVRNRG
jgi:hypothetical protein